MPHGAERNLHLALTLAAWVLVALRAAWVPLIHDEAATFQMYVLTGDYLPWSAHWDAGNHLLATAAARVSYLLFGDPPFALRLFPVLCYGLWAWYAWRITRGLAAASLRIAASAALLLTPFLFEFFALFRGYGPALAFLLMAVHHGLAYAARAARRDLLLMLLAATLACSASLTVLLLGLLLLSAGALRTFTARRNDASAWAMLLLLGALPLMALAFHGKELSDRGLLYFGSSEGLLHGTLASLGEWVLGIPWPLMGASVLLAPLLMALVALRRSAHRIVLASLILLFAGELLGRVVLGAAFGVLYPMDRTAMHLVPLAILLLAHAADTTGPALRPSLAAALLALLPARTLARMSLDRTSYWPEQALPESIIDAAAERQQAAERPLLVGGYHQNACVWAYASMRRGGLLNFMDATGFPQPVCDLLVLDPGHFAAPDGFTRIAQARHGRAALFERTRPLGLVLQVDSAINPVEGDTEYHDLPAPGASELAANDWLMELDARFSSTIEPLRLRLVIEVKDTDGGLLHYEANDLERLRPRWHGDRLRIARRIPRIGQGQARVAAYLWNPWRMPYRMDAARLRLSRLEP